MPNPFFYGGRIAPEQFVGRRAELRRIFAGLDIAHTGQMQSFSVVGPRRIGKSSLLFYIAQRHAHYLTVPPVIASEAKQSPTPESEIAAAQPFDSAALRSGSRLAMTQTAYRFAYIELQDARCHTLTGLLDNILTQLGASERVGNTSPLVAFQDAIVALRARGALPVVCLDEFEELVHRREQFTLDFYESLRYLMNQHALALVTASKTPLIDLAQTLGYTSPFFNIFTHLPLGELTDDEARELIARGATCDRAFTPTEQMEILTLAGNHPYKLQLAGSLLYLAKGESRAVDWAHLRREFVRQLQHVGLEADIPRTLRRVGEKSKGTVIDAAKAAIRELFKAWIDSWNKSR